MTGLVTLLQAAAQVGTQTARAAATTASDNPAATLGLAVTIPFFLQTLKNASWFPWLSKNSSRINFAIGVVAALVASLGIHATWDPTHGGTIVIPGAHDLWQGFIQWAGQQVAYKGLVVPAETLGDIRKLLEAQVGPVGPPQP